MASIFSLLPVFDWVLWTSAKVSILIIFLLLVKFLFRHKLGATGNYLLWTAVFVGLLLPWTPSSSLSIYNLAKPYTQTATGESSSYFFNNHFDKLTVPQKTNAAGTDLTPVVGEQQPQSKSALRAIVASPLTYQCLFLIWLFGVIAFLVSTIVVNKKFSRSIQGQTIYNWYKLAALEGIIQKLNISRDIPLTFTSAVGSPSLFGLFNPRILLPTAVIEHFTQEQLAFIFVHELSHYKRKDIFVNWLMQGLLILHWFNPLIWYASRKLREDQEQACDAMTLQYYGPDKSKGYAGTLIKLLECYSKPLRMANLTGLSGSNSLLKRRLMNIKNSPKSSIAFMVLILGIVVLTAIVTLADAEILPGTENGNLPLPTSATQIDGNQKRTIPFPYAQHFSNGSEQWLLERDSSNHFVLKVLFNNQEKAIFPVKATGVNQVAGKITLDGKDYSVVSITLNTDQTSGWVTLQSSSVLPASIQTISISDDSPEGIFWIPKSQKEVLAQVSSWLNAAKPYTATLPASDAVDNTVHHNIGPSALHITGSENFETLIYPAWYVKTGGQKVDARFIGDYIHYQQDVVVLIEAGTNQIYYFESAPLYNWLKSGAWKPEFSQNSALIPLYRINENDETYGSSLGHCIYGNPLPDLISALGVDGTSGYVKYIDLMGPQPKTPEEAIEMQKEGKFDNREIPLYAVDGKTMIGSFK